MATVPYKIASLMAAVPYEVEMRNFDAQIDSPPDSD